jgi:cob(I)alamin adenosyltransferase
MADLSTREKLQRLIPHWIEHNCSHAAEFKRWAEQAAADGHAQAAARIDNAAALLRRAEAELTAALEQAGGPAGHHHDGGHHQHSHHE